MDKKVRADLPNMTPSQAGDFEALFAQLDRPGDKVSVDSGYAELMARLASPAYRRQHGRH